MQIREHLGGVCYTAIENENRLPARGRKRAHLVEKVRGQTWLDLGMPRISGSSDLEKRKPPAGQVRFLRQGMEL